MRKSFADVPGRASGPRLAKLSGGLEADPAQTGDAIVVTIVLDNEGSADLLLKNPFATVQFDIRGSRGQSFAVPTAAPSALIHMVGGPKAWTAADHPIPVIEVRRDDEVTDRTALDGETIVTPAHQRWSATFAVNRIAERDGLGSPAHTAFSSPAEGRYTVAAVITVIDAENLDEARIVQTAPLDISVAGRD